MLYFPKPKTKSNPIGFTNHHIPYLPELRGYCQSVTACLLMTQLEYRFVAMPDGFYKFLSPCVHHLYKEGDSWIEELAFSEAEFRSAFDNIGIRYRSKRQLQETIDANQDPFQRKLYLSYIDVKNGLTYYQRNHELAVTVIDNLLNSSHVPCELQPEPALGIEFLGLNIANSQR